MYEARVPLLKKEVDNTEKAMVEYKQQWAQIDIVNFLVNSPKDLVFIRSMDVSNVVKDANLLFKILDNLVEEVKQENVVQVVTDASNYIKASKK